MTSFSSEATFQRLAYFERHLSLVVACHFLGTEHF